MGKGGRWIISSQRPNTKANKKLLAGDGKEQAIIIWPAEDVPLEANNWDVNCGRYDHRHTGWLMDENLLTITAIEADNAPRPVPTVSEFDGPVQLRLGGACKPPVATKL